MIFVIMGFIGLWNGCRNQQSSLPFKLTLPCRPFTIGIRGTKENREVQDDYHCLHGR